MKVAFGRDRRILDEAFDLLLNILRARIVTLILGLCLKCNSLDHALEMRLEDFELLTSCDRSQNFCGLCRTELGRTWRLDACYGTA